MLSLLIVLPVVLLLLSALGIAIMQQSKPSIGWSWIWASLISLVSLGIVIALHWRIPLVLTFEQWRPFGEFSNAPALLLDHISWPYAVALSALLVAVFLTDAARLQNDSGPLTWITSLAIAGLGLMAVLAGNPFTLVLVWTMIDLVELVAVFSSRIGRWLSQPMIIAFAVRVTGTLVVLVAILVGQGNGIPFSLTPIPAELAVLMLVAAGLRLGVLPLNIPYTREVYSWRGLGNLLRMVGPASSLVVLGRMPTNAVPGEWQNLFLFFSALAAIYGSAMWLASDPSHTARPYWIIALAGMAVASVTDGMPQASIAWGLALILSGNVLFLFTAQNRRILWIPLLALLGIVGLPFTPAAVGWQGVMGPWFDFYGFLFMLSVLLLCGGFLRRVLQPRDELYIMERWIHTVYPAGLLILILTQWAIHLLDWGEKTTVGVWWASIPLVVVLGLTSVFMLIRRPRLSGSSNTHWLLLLGQRVGGGLSALFRLNWIYQTLGWLYQVTQNIVQMLTDIFEGDGGILWAMVMLGLLISLVTAGGMP